MDSFHPIIQQWFASRYGKPTDIQQQAWPEIASGKHLLITAPTGSGKTLTAFLCAINRLATGDLPVGATRVLYISPLKALNNDIARNLLQPLEELREAFAAAAVPFPEIRVMTRSGDTDQDSRRRMLRHPPEILITTPESLHLMLSSRGGQGLLQNIDTLILDEIHAIAESKRGVLLMSAVERLVPLCSNQDHGGEFQRLALSATVRPMEAVAALVGGFRRDASGFSQRTVSIIQSGTPKHYDISVRAMSDARDGDKRSHHKGSESDDHETSGTQAGDLGQHTKQADSHDPWGDLARDLLVRIRQNKSTLVFVNSRALCEKLTFKINEVAGQVIAWAHHGSLARDLRAEVEARLKDGSLAAIVATSSLELGIDIGALDEVILVQSPGSIAATIQRIGRAGHQVGATSRCSIYPTHALDIVESAVLADAVQAGDLEPMKIVSRPLDVLSQVLISMAGTATGDNAWQLDDLFMEVRRATAFQQLTRLEFDLVINMLAGRYADRRVRELKPRISIDHQAGQVEANKGALLALYLGGGVIPDRGYFQLRHQDDMARIGELDEEFVWEARVGQQFTLGAQTWQIKSITHNDVIVSQGKPGAMAPPFWRAESISRSFHYAQKIGQFLEAANSQLDDPQIKQFLAAANSQLDDPPIKQFLAAANSQLDDPPIKQILAAANSQLDDPQMKQFLAAEHSLVDNSSHGHFPEPATTQLEDPGLAMPAFAQELVARYKAEPAIAREIISFLSRQREATGTDLPHRHHLLAECIETPAHTRPAQVPGQQLVLHTGWGARVNRPLALAMEAAWQQQQGEQLEVFVANEALVVQLPDELDADTLLGLVTPDKIESLLRHRLEGSGFFGARFRENAGRALLLAKGRFNERKPLWMSRLQSQKLLDQVMKYADFPILLETWRTCLQDEFDLAALRQLLDEVNEGSIRVSSVQTSSPSPFAASLAWDQINIYMYATDAPKGAGPSSGKSSLATSLLQEVVHDPHLRPALAPDLVELLRLRLHRLEPGFVPVDAEELLDWVVERSFIPTDEWQELTEAADVDLGLLEGRLQVKSQVNGVMAAAKSHRIMSLLADGTTQVRQGDDASGDNAELTTQARQGDDASGDNAELTTQARQTDGAFSEADDDPLSLTDFLANWLQHYGPLSASDMAAKLGLSASSLLPALAQLVDEETLIQGRLLAGENQDYFCDADNYEYLLRLARQASRPNVPCRGISNLPAFMFAWQTVFSGKDPVDQLFDTIDRLRGYPAAPALWEQEIFPARIKGYSTRHLDILFSEGELQWRGLGEMQVGFCLRHDDCLPVAATASTLITQPYARYDFNSLIDMTGLTSAELARQLWQEVWQGIITNDAIATLRQGISNRFAATSLTQTPQARASRSKRGAFNRWRSENLGAGAWHCLTSQQDDSLLGKMENTKEQARLLLHRYGVVFRELMQRETALAPWREIFRALRLMELSGEVVSGRFFDTIPGPQYMTPQALRLFLRWDLAGMAGKTEAAHQAEDSTKVDAITQADNAINTNALPQANHAYRVGSAEQTEQAAGSTGAIFFINATDPISPAGLGLKVLDAELPTRVASNHLVIHGNRLVLTSRKQGRVLHFHCPADDPSLHAYLDLLHHLAYRSYSPLRRLQIEEINGEPARTSPWLAAIEAKFNVIQDYQSVTIQREL